MLMISSRNLRVPSGEVVYLSLRHAYEPSQYAAGLDYYTDRPSLGRPNVIYLLELSIRLMDHPYGAKHPHFR